VEMYCSCVFSVSSAISIGSICMMGGHGYICDQHVNTAAGLKTIYCYFTFT
jgi:hypothetical protein